MDGNISRVLRISVKIQLYSWLVTVILGISFLWQLLEYLIYGEIQPRIVDDIVGLTYVIAILYAYKMGRSHEREAQRNYKHIENYWSNPPILCESVYNQKYNQ